MRRKDDQLLELVWGRQYVDWRELRRRPWQDPEVQAAVEELAERLRDRLAGAGLLPPPMVVLGRSTSASSQNVPLEPTSSAIPAPHTTSDVFNAAPSAGTHQDVLVVDGRSTGLRTITEAIARAPEGARIHVRPGLYEEHLTLDKPLEIIGEHASAVVVQWAGQPVLQSTAQKGRVSGLHLRQVTAGDGEAVSIGAGGLLLQDCRITSSGFACVVVDDGADPQLQDNRINSDRGYGVILEGTSRGRLENNDITARASAAVFIRGRSDPVLRSNRLMGSKCGVTVSGSGRGRLEDNQIIRNELAGILIAEKGAPTVVESTISGNQYGVFVLQGGSGHFEGNDLRGNLRSAWRIAPASARQVSCVDNRDT
jgi:parallel beta-helix repeat protein